MEIDKNLQSEIFESLKKRYIECEIMAFEKRDKILDNAILKEVEVAEKEIEKLKKQISIYDLKISELKKRASDWNFKIFAKKARENHKEKWKNKFVPLESQLHYSFKEDHNDSNIDSSDSNYFSENEFYNDQLDIDQQDPEFWNNL